MSDVMEVEQRGPEKAPVGKGLGDSSVAAQFTDLPIGVLLCEPVLQTARGQAALCDIYVDNVMRLAYKNYDPKNPTQETNVVTLTYDKPVADKETGVVSIKTFKVDAPLITLVPLPAFLMEELTVAFTMDVKITDTVANNSHEEISDKTEFSFWGVSSTIEGKVTSDQSHTRTTDNSAHYELHLRAAQQPPSEGMAKLTSLFSQAMEPIEMTKA